AQAALNTIAQQIGPDSPAQLQNLLELSRSALAAGIRAGFWLSFGAALLVLVLVMLMRKAQVSVAAIAEARREGLDEGGLGAL
ncbi:hypothetical protein SE17_37165, partial [Kouleothrix aurantiaca]